MPPTDYQCLTARAATPGNSSRASAAAVASPDKQLGGVHPESERRTFAAALRRARRRWASARAEHRRHRQTTRISSDRSSGRRTRGRSRPTRSTPTSGARRASTPTSRSTSSKASGTRRGRQVPQISAIRCQRSGRRTRPLALQSRESVELLRPPRRPATSILSRNRQLARVRLVERLDFPHQLVEVAPAPSPSRAWRSLNVD